MSPPVLHRDLKSPNVLIASTDPRVSKKTTTREKNQSGEESGEEEKEERTNRSSSQSPEAVAKITDFGLSLHLHVDQLKAKDGKNRHVVNPTWLAPEILNMSMGTGR